MLNSKSCVVQVEHGLRFYSGIWTLYVAQRTSGLSSELPVVVLDPSLTTGALVHGNNKAFLEAPLWCYLSCCECCPVLSCPCVMLTHATALDQCAR